MGLGLTTEKHIFAIEKAVFETLTMEEVVETVKAMREVGVFKFPYEGQLYVRIRPDAIHTITKQKFDGKNNDYFEIPLFGDEPIRVVRPYPKGFDPLIEAGAILDRSRREVLTLFSAPPDQGRSLRTILAFALPVIL